MVKILFCIVMGCAVGFGLSFWIFASILEKSNRVGDDPDVYYKFTPVLRESRHDQIPGDQKSRDSYIRRNQQMLAQSDMYRNYKKHSIPDDMFSPMEKYLPGSEPMTLSDEDNVEDLTYSDFNDLDDFGNMKQ